jgi:hypothetical protein
VTALVIDLALDGSDGVLRLVPLSGTQVHEGARYPFRVIGDDRTVTTLEPTELFRAYPDRPNEGDFSPQQCVGDVRIHLTFDDGTTATTTVEVLPTKLEYETEYRAMLEQIADHAAEAILQGFAPASFETHADPTAAAETKYRTLAFLAARFRDEAFQTAIERIRHQPHHDWAHYDERRSLGRGLRTSPSTARALQRGPASAPRPAHLSHLPLPYLPSAIDDRRTGATYDTPPNQFLRFAFSRWQGLALDVLDSLAPSASLGAGPLGRGRREAQWIVDQCEDVLSLPALRDAGRLKLVPTGNQVLLKRPGYREVLRTFALAEASMALEAVLPDDPFSATQRNVAALYEYWCFIALSRIVSAVAGVEPQGLLFERSANGLSLVLKQGEPSKLSWELEIDGRVLVADLWFNRTFKRTDDARADMGSWARQLRPDASLRIRPKSARPKQALDPELDVWLHFDAKYRIDQIVLNEAIDGEGEEVEEVDRPERGAKREDLMKMHAYRDAIRRSAGAYVLYPGDGTVALSTEFHEILPGIGAFPLRPGAAGEVSGSAALEEFLREVTGHLANQASAMERTQYWTAQYNRTQGRRVRPVDFLTKPPADSAVVVGYVRAEQLQWVTRTRQYNVRVGSRRGAVDLADELLTSGLIVLWTRSDAGEVEIIGGFERTGPWQFATAADLTATGYPDRHADNRYLVTPIDPLPTMVERLVKGSTIAARPNYLTGAPWCTTWAELTGVAPE